jgi:hypothetical protein
LLGKVLFVSSFFLFFVKKNENKPWIASPHHEGRRRSEQDNGGINNGQLSKKKRKEGENKCKSASRGRHDAHNGSPFFIMQKKNVYSEIYGNARCLARQGEDRLALDYFFHQPPIPPTENNAAARERVTRKQQYASRSRLVPLTHIPPAQEHVRTELGARRKWRLHFTFTQG